MSNKEFSWSNLFSDVKFQSREIDTEEFETIIKETVGKEHPGDPIVELKYDEDGVDVILESGDVIGIEVDWQEIVLA